MIDNVTKSADVSNFSQVGCPRIEYRKLGLYNDFNLLEKKPEEK